ncbi:MAG: hypothetical protein WD595_02825 [Waddliaceae bacterium]
MAQPPSSDRGKLNEKNFIQPPSRGVASWLWVLIAIVLIAIFWIFSASMLDQVRSRLWEKPFLQVTNREFSLFLWQNPEYMRRNQSKEIGYLPGFVSFEGKMTPDPKYADQFVAAPPKFLYRYHLWKFFLGEYVFNRSIPNQEFQAFLAYSTEWQPENWKGATDGYLSLLTTLEIDRQMKILQIFQLMRSRFKYARHSSDGKTFLRKVMKSTRSTRLPPR